MHIVNGLELFFYLCKFSDVTYSLDVLEIWKSDRKVMISTLYSRYSHDNILWINDADLK